MTPVWEILYLVGIGLLVLVGGWIMLTQTLLRVVRKFIYQFPAPAFVGYVLDSDFRRFWQRPETLIARSGFQEGMTVLELGCGSGAYTTYVARAIGPSGRLVALDIQPAMLQQLQRKLDLEENQDIHNVELVEASAYELPFEEGTFDLVYLNTVLPEIPHPAKALAEIMRVLKPSGLLAVTECLSDPDYPLRSTTIKRGVGAGFQVQGTEGRFWHYTVRFQKPA